MSLTVFLAVIASAFMHASWNLLVKINLDRFLSVFLLSFFTGVMGLAMLCVFAWPSAASLPYALASGALHTGYNVFLARSYRDGDLGQVYPIARGTAPLVTLLATWGFAHEQVSALLALGIVILVAGIWMLATAKSHSPRPSKDVVFFALVTSCFIAAYTLVDGLGGRASQSASGYSGLVFVLDAVFMSLWAFNRRGFIILRQVAPAWKSGCMAAALSAGAYWIVIWAMTQAPIAAVAALREVSILFVLLLSARYLKETLTLRRLLGGLCVVAGAIILRIS